MVRVIVLVRGTNVDHSIVGPDCSDEAAEADMEKIRTALGLHVERQLIDARTALPGWIIVDPDLILAAHIVPSIGSRD